jgi:hypothetical protein
VRVVLRLPAVGTLKRYSKALEYEYRVKTAALDTLEPFGWNYKPAEKHCWLIFL